MADIQLTKEMAIDMIMSIKPDYNEITIETIANSYGEWKTIKDEHGNTIEKWMWDKKLLEEEDIEILYELWKICKHSKNENLKEKWERFEQIINDEFEE